MKYFTNLIIILIGLIILTGIAFIGYQFYMKLHGPAESPYKAIPANASLVIKVNKPGQLWHESMNTNQMWRNLLAVPAITVLTKEVNFLDSTISLNPKINEAIRKNPLFIVVSPVVARSYGLLYLININENQSEDQVNEYLQKTWSSGIITDKKSYAGSTLFGISFKNGNTPFYFAIKSKIFIGSKEPSLVKQAIDRLSLNLNMAEDVELKKVIASSGKNVDANIFIHYPGIAPMVNEWVTEGTLSNYLNVSYFASWSGLDLIQKRDHWFINGYTVCKDSNTEYLSLFAGQNAQQISMTRIIPDETLSFFWVGLSDVGIYHRKLISSALKTSIYFPLNLNLSRIEEENHFHLSDFFLPWVGNEIGLITMKSRNPSNENIPFGIFRINEKSLADSLLQSLLKYGPREKPSVNYKNHKIYSSSIPGIIPAVWGNLFSRLDGFYFTSIEDYFVFANDQSSLELFIDHNISGNSIVKNSAYIDLATGISDQVNLFYYCNLNRCFDQIQSILNDHLKKEINPAKDSLRRFESFGLQIIRKDEDFYTQVFIHPHQSDPNKGPLVWQTALETSMTGKPKLVESGFKGKPAILVFDAANMLYLLDDSGSIQWKLQLPGKPMGEIHSFRLNKNDSIHFVLNTTKHLCIIDDNGLFESGSPFLLPKGSSTGLTFVEKSLTGAPFCLLPLEDRKVYAIDLRGKNVPQWQKPLFGSPFSKPVQTLQLKDRIIFIINGTDGKVLITDQYGKTVIRLKEKILFSPYSSWYLNKTNKKGELIASAMDGKLVYVKTDGKTSTVQFNEFTTGHIFFYTDINNDRIQEFTYFDLDKLYCYNRFQKLLMDNSFPAGTEAPFMIALPSGEIQLGVVSPKTSDIFLFGKNGLIALDPIIRGTTGFDIGILEQEKGTSLVIGSGKYVKNFLLSKN